MLRDVSSRNIPAPGTSEWGSSLSPDCFVSRASIPHVSVSEHFVLQGVVVSISPNHQVEGSPLVGCPRLLIQFVRSYPPYRRPFLYPQPEDAPCRGDRDPLHYLGVDGWIILGWISMRWDVGIWTGLSWPRIETGGGRL